MRLASLLALLLLALLLLGRLLCLVGLLFGLGVLLKNAFQLGSSQPF